MTCQVTNQMSLVLIGDLPVIGNDILLDLNLCNYDNYVDFNLYNYVVNTNLYDYDDYVVDLNLFLQLNVLYSVFIVR